MTATAIATPVLTPADVKALQRADKVVFRHYQGVATVEAYLDGGLDHDRVYTATEQRLYPTTDRYGADRTRVMQVEGTVSAYTATADRRQYPQASCFAWIPSAQYSDTWHSLASLLRTGDALTLEWNGDGYANEITRKAGLHVDRLRLRIQRKGATRPLLFLLDVSVGLDNTARMIRV